MLTSDHNPFLCHRLNGQHQLPAFEDGDRFLYITTPCDRIYVNEQSVLMRSSKLLLYGKGTVSAKVPLYGYELCGKQLPFFTSCLTVPFSLPSYSEQLFDLVSEQPACGAVLHCHLCGCLLTEMIRQRKYTDSLIIELCQYLQENYHENIGLKELAEKSHFNKNYLIRRFRATTGLAPIEYLILIRLSKAQELLVTTTLSVAEVAWHCGYHSPAFFNTYFKKKTGMTPRQYRTAYRNHVKKNVDGVSETGDKNERNK